jgi:hypothetical protein
MLLFFYRSDVKNLIDSSAVGKFLLLPERRDSEEFPVSGKCFCPRH